MTDARGGRGDEPLAGGGSSRGLDRQRALASVVSLRSTVADDAYTASTLGTERSGSGVVIGDGGLILTIGYLIAEAETVWIGDSTGHAAPGYALGYDHETGFGLVQALRRLAVPALPLGSSARLREGDRLTVAGAGETRAAVEARVVAKREFAGYWEYVLDEAIFTAPPHPNWGGTAAVADDGTLCGIGSLLVQQVAEGESVVAGNMVVPIDLLKPILDDLVTLGRPNKPARPWLGIYTTEADGRLVVAGLVRDGPADRAHARVGDVVTEVAGVPVSDLARLYRRVWSLGSAGVEVPLTVLRGGKTAAIRVRSASRFDYLKAPRVH
jgi:S1-C subfamily serine protease